MQMTGPVRSVTNVVRSRPSSDDGVDWDGIDLDGLLEQAEEEEPAAAGAAAVEAEGELVQVVVEVARAHAAVVRAEQPALEQGSLQSGTRASRMRPERPPGRISTAMTAIA